MQDMILTLGVDIPHGIIAYVGNINIAAIINGDPVANRLVGIELNFTAQHIRRQFGIKQILSVYPI